jgi:hypothetical protein
MDTLNLSFNLFATLLGQPIFEKLLLRIRFGKTFYHVSRVLHALWTPLYMRHSRRIYRFSILHIPAYTFYCTYTITHLYPPHFRFELATLATNVTHYFT